MVIGVSGHLLPISCDTMKLEAEGSFEIFGTTKNYTVF
jgi:hypothetical protein